MPAGKIPILILGGTAEARALAGMLVKHEQFQIITSLAGRTNAPRRPAGEVRIGGFGGADGLAEYLQEQRIRLVVDATHPYAAKISANAGAAAGDARVDRIALVRPEWTPQSSLGWQEVKDIRAARDAIPPGATAFLALGSQYISPFFERDDISYVARMVDEPEKHPFRGCRIITGAPGNKAAERSLFKREVISHLVCRNSGGDAGFAKIEAAWDLGIEILLIRRPRQPSGPIVCTVEEVMSFIFDTFAL